MAKNVNYNGLSWNSTDQQLELYVRGILSAQWPTGGVAASTSRSATLVVAASDASAQSILGADYPCNGTADDVQVNAAIAALPS